MVAVVSGEGLGLFNASNGLGNAVSGQSGEAVYVNSTTGNLVIQGRDEFLSGSGLDIPLVRTYNSQGLFTDDNGDNWQLNVHQRLIDIPGSPNTNGSTITRVGGDGSETLYAYNTTSGQYESTDGQGAHDTLSYSGGVWTWQEGGNGTIETVLKIP